MLVKNQYQGETDRRAGHGALCYQIRQAFPHGEVTAEEANRIGYETAMRWTKGKYQFFVCTHIDKEHIHNHIYYNSTAYDRSRKFRNFIGSSFALRRLSDRVCLEHDLSVIANPKLHSKGRYLHYGQWLGENQKLSQKEQIRLAIAAALPFCPGSPLVNSISGEADRMAHLGPLCRQWGAPFILLPIQGRKLPVKAADRIAYNENMLDTAAMLASPRRLVLADVLALAVAS